MNIHPDLNRLLIGGDDLLSEVDQISKYLAGVLSQIHGGKWRVSVNHENCFVIVARDFSDQAEGKK